MRIFKMSGPEGLVAAEEGCLNFALMRFLAPPLDGCGMQVAGERWFCVRHAAGFSGLACRWP